MPTIIIDVDNHRHDGDLVPKGTQLDADAQTAVWMIERNKAHFAEPLLTKALDKKDKNND